jgi:hypothetical protein
VVKGEAYFALTSSCVMAGGRLEVAFDDAGIYASFTAYADFLIAWDPFQYDIAVGVSVTAGFRLRVCFFACVTIDVHVTLGASVHLLGPPLRGEATLDLEICSVTVAFGNEPHDPPTFMGWEAFRDKYVVAGAADGNALTVQAASGLIPPDGAAAVPVPGSPTHPWRLAGTFSLRTETRLAATRYLGERHTRVRPAQRRRAARGNARPRAHERSRHRQRARPHGDLGEPRGTSRSTCPARVQLRRRARAAAAGTITDQRPPPRPWCPCSLTHRRPCRPAESGRRPGSARRSRSR